MVWWADAGRGKCPYCGAKDAALYESDLPKRLPQYFRATRPMCKQCFLKEYAGWADDLLDVDARYDDSSSS